MPPQDEPAAPVPPNLHWFAKVAPYLKHPLVLIGFALLLLYGFFQGLVASGLLKPVPSEESGGILRLLLTYSFVLALAVIVLGFVVQLRSGKREQKPDSEADGGRPPSPAPPSPAIEAQPRPTPPIASQGEARSLYLQRLRRHCQALPLQELGGDEGAGPDVTLDQVYIDLDTTTLDPDESQSRHREAGEVPTPGEDTSKKLSALEAATRERRLVLLGDPGGGKSTFAHSLLSKLAAVSLGAARPLAGFDPDLLPLLVLLRDLAVRLARFDHDALSGDHLQDALTQAVLDEVQDSLRRIKAEGYASAAQQALITGRVLLVLDGLDEVPEADRPGVRQAVDALLKRFRIERLLITCRIRSYRGTATVPGFTAHTIAPLDADKIKRFAVTWYRAQQELGRFDEQQAKDKGADLTRAALSVALEELSKNPMLLTTMALIHQREIGLPKERARLYNLAVEVLLWRWQKRIRGDLVPAPELAAFLGDPQRLRPALEHLAYKAHGGGRDRDGEADLSRGDALTLLGTPSYLGDLNLSGEFLDYVDQRAGLLVGRGGEPEHPSSYSFPHRTFQEYLAGCHMVGRRRPHIEYFARAGDGDQWSEAAQLGGEELLYQRRSQNALLDLVYQLRPQQVTSEHEHRSLLWAAKLAALVGAPVLEADTDGPAQGPVQLAQLRQGLVKLFESDLRDLERAEAGVALAQLGDPRTEVTTVEDMRFCRVPAGRFWLGSDGADEGARHDEEPAGECEIPYEYWLGRYPVTHAQYQTFVDTGGYSNPLYWTEAREAGVWLEGRLVLGDDQVEAPQGYGEPFNLPNHPVVGVSWFEAWAFCRFLAAKLRVRGELDAQWVVGLPSEIEWEKAARGGLEVPEERTWATCREACGMGPAILEANDLPRRRYPWGDEPPSDRASHSGSGIRGTSAVGVFDQSQSPYGCAELAGNVWEWTRSRYAKYPYPETLEERSRRESGASSSLVLRGGSFFTRQFHVRCAARLGGGPAVRHYDVGFRVALLPSKSLEP